MDRGVDRPASAIRAYAKWRILPKRHPEWFGLVGGRRVPTGVALRKRLSIKGDSSMPCMSNPETLHPSRFMFGVRSADLDGLGLDDLCLRVVESS